MLRNTKGIEGYKLAASDGVFGKVKDFLFDDEHWTIRYMVADTGGWLPGQKVLVSPVSLGEADWDSHTLQVRLTKDEIGQAPNLDEKAPVSRKYEKRWFDTYQWPYYWGGAGVWSGGIFPSYLYMQQNSQTDDKSETEMPDPEEDSQSLRSVNEVKGYHIQAIDGDIGHVEDFIVDDQTWTIRYAVVDTRNWLPGKKVLVAPRWINSVAWADQAVSVDLSRDLVKNSPPYDPKTPVNRDYEEQLYDYYGRPVYWG